MTAEQPEASWKDQLYAHYVSSGQAAGTVTAHPDEMFASRRPYLQAIIQRHVPAARDQHIIDLGCGHGALLYYLQEASYKNISGIDISVEQVTLAHQLGLTMVKKGDILQSLCDLDTSSVDLFFLMDVLEHLTRAELFAYLTEISRALVPGGRCIIHVPNAEGLFGLRMRYSDLTHELAFTPRSVTQLFQTFHFSQITCHEDRPIIYSATSLLRSIIWRLGTLYHRLLLMAETGNSAFVLSSNMLVVAIK